MNYPKIPLAQQLILLCEVKGIKHVVISPGSRNAPLTIGFASHPKIKTYSIVDERCAAFFALGMAQQLNEPTAVVCTSGSALLNYYPAVAEAFYSDIPLVIISADRPAHLIDVGDGQTIRQENIFEKHLLYAANLIAEGIADSELLNAKVAKLNNEVTTAIETKVSNNIKLINEALNIAISQKGPVHINIPFEEPLYKTVTDFTENVSEIHPTVIDKSIVEDDFQEFISRWNASTKKMVLVGVLPPNSVTQDQLSFLTNDDATVVFTESTSNLEHKECFCSIDKMIAPLDDEEFQALQPEVLMTFGGMIVSKKVKAFLRNYKPKYHYHINDKKAFDTFFSLTHHFKIKPKVFLDQLVANHMASTSDYSNYWKKVRANRAIKHQDYINQISFSDLKVFDVLWRNIPQNIILHLSNSSTIRYAQLFDQLQQVTQYCNRGTSGIDGSTSTAIGHASVTNEQNILITGDLSFFYDSNGLWNNYIPSNFRIIVVNNGGGGIFRILPGQKNTANFERYFETIHDLNASQLCEMHKLEYNTASNEEELIASLSNFFEQSMQPKLLEIFTPRLDNDEILLAYFKHLGRKD